MRSSSRTIPRCTVPALLYSQWSNNYGEYILRVPTLVHQFQDMQLLNRRMSYMLGIPAKLPAEPFNMDLLRPLMDLEPTTFRDFSRPQPDGTPSRHTAEGTAVRCFERMVVGRIFASSYPHTARMAPVISQYYAEKNLLKATSSPWRDTGPDTLRVLIERRPSGMSRQLWGTEQLLQDCEQAPPLTTPSGRALRLQCISYAFGRSDFAADMAVLRITDVIVAVHGAGAMNILFAPQASSLIEIRPRDFGTTHGEWPNTYMPKMCLESSWQFLFWGLNVDDPELSTAGALEAAGRLMGPQYAARDRHVQLKWAMLWPILEQLVQVDRDVGLYQDAVRNRTFLWLAEAGGKFGLAPEYMATQTLTAPSGSVGAGRRSLTAAHSRGALLPM
ncbi:hypothetical protein TSOC_004666 [Tetrabaena socialis]|uniref:Glycosyltransferase 61 catalytic domain-containing protein n=1 Tax=Tetrabaena socialis TaxID=47790 RepID=A0A2J8A8F5_9CHLO|nr:hypothetical protein TSOC_004666 [Tetrabaena socialis]|eukprot:PNH08790.1 hypothetical protein TSOC_004666 [Tetrabaena socialis]